MARFGQGFINALTRPSYAQGLFETASALGSAPRRAAEERERKGMLQGLQEALISNDPAVMEAAAANIFQTNPEMGVKLIEKAQGLRTTAQEGRTSRGLQGGLTGITQASSMLNAARAAKDPAKTQEAAQMLREAKRSVVGLGGTAEDIREAEKVAITDAKGFTLPAGSARYEPDPTSPTGYKKVGEAPFKDEGKELVFELVKGGKYTPESIQDAVISDGSIDYSQLVPVSNEDTPARGAVSSAVEKRYGKLSEESTKASVALSRNRALQQTLLTSPAKSTGIVSDLRTSALNLAGLRDAEEETKTQFLRTRNTDIINSLPPGVASDTDVRIFSQGFPSENASTEEITAYLQAEERILAAASDMALVADRYLQKQIDSGLDATMVGFEDKKQQYGVIMKKALSDMAAQIAKENAVGADATAIEIRVISEVAEILGFVPKFYR